MSVLQKKTRDENIQIQSGDIRNKKFHLQTCHRFSLYTKSK